MAETDPTKTIIGSSLDATWRMGTLTDPDGNKQEVLMQRARTADGKEVWERVDEKLLAFDKRFASTRTFPAAWADPQTSALAARYGETKDTIMRGGVTRLNISAELIKTLGSPEGIIERKGLMPDKQAFMDKNPQLFSVLVGLAKQHGGVWEKAASFLKPLHQTP